MRQLVKYCNVQKCGIPGSCWKGSYAHSHQYHDQQVNRLFYPRQWQHDPGMSFAWGTWPLVWPDQLEYGKLIWAESEARSTPRWGVANAPHFTWSSKKWKGIAGYIAIGLVTKAASLLASKAFIPHIDPWNEITCLLLLYDAELHLCDKVTRCDCI